MKVYFDVSCLNRPFDEQSQPRIRLESEAVLLALDWVGNGRIRHVSSEIAEIEIIAMPDIDRRRKVMSLLPEKIDRMNIAEAHFLRAAVLEKLGIKAADALHVAAAEAQNADVLLTCDDRLCRLGKKLKSKVGVRIFNPIEWIKEQAGA